MVRTVRRYRPLLAAALAAVFITSITAVAASVAYDFVVHRSAARHPDGARTAVFRQGSQTRYITERQAAWQGALARGRDTGGTLGLLSVVLILVFNPDTPPRAGEGESDDPPHSREPPASDAG